jgi:hypothetical protein
MTATYSKYQRGVMTGERSEVISDQLVAFE